MLMVLLIGERSRRKLHVAYPPFTYPQNLPKDLSDVVAQGWVLFDMISVYLTLSIYPKCTSYFVNLSKITWLRKPINLRNFYKSADTNGRVCYQDCVSLLQHFGDTRQLRAMDSLYAFLLKYGFHQYVFLQNNMIKGYATGGDLLKARLLFDEMRERNMISWTSMLTYYVNDGQNQMSLWMFYLMCRSGFRPNEFGFAMVLKACKSTNNFIMGQLLHGQVLKSGFIYYSFCNSSILGMYVVSGDANDAHKFFHGIPPGGRSEALWNTLLESYVRTSEAEVAIDSFNQMTQSNISPNSFTYTNLIKLCANMSSFSFGRSIHGQIIKVGLENHGIVGGALVDAYVKFEFLNDAYEVFLCLEEKDNVVWCTLISGFHRIGDAKQGLKCYVEFLKEENKPDPFIFSSAISLCSDLENAFVGTQLHCSFIKYGFLLDSILGTSLINMYSGDGMLYDACRCFNEVRNKNEICFSSIISNLVSHGSDEKAIELFNQMRDSNLTPSSLTLSYIIRACANLYNIKEGKSAHSQFLKTFLGDCASNICIENALIEMYVKCGAVDTANMVLKQMKMKSEFSWTTIISGYSIFGPCEKALEVFNDMCLLSTESVKLSEFTIIAVLQACTKVKSLYKGQQVHGYVIKIGFGSHPFIGSALINIYAATSPDSQNAHLVFSRLKVRDLVSYSSMITVFAQKGESKEALRLFIEFQTEPFFSIDETLLSSCLSACADSEALENGKSVHAIINKFGFEFHIHIVSSMIAMYSKCGGIKDARKLFGEARDHNVVSWTAMISGYAHHGFANEAIKLFDEMKEGGLEPDSVTFIGVLTACSHAGLVNEGCKYFELLRAKHETEVTISHFACMVDILGRAEQVEQAEALIKKAPFESKVPLWKTLLGACNKHGNVEVGNRVANILVELEPNEPSTYVSMSNIYASASMWENSCNVRIKMKTGNVVKNHGYSWIQVTS